jgi:hypothetical protein
MNFSVVVRFFRDAVGMFCSVSVDEMRARSCLETYVVYGGEGAVWSSYFAASISEALKSLLLWCERLSELIAVFCVCLLVMSLRGQDACLQNSKHEVRWRKLMD